MTAKVGRPTADSSRTFFFDRINLPIGLQFYTLGLEAGRDVDAAFGSIAQIGYREIELPSLLGRKPAEVRAAADRAGLAVSGLHVPLVEMSVAGTLSFGSEPDKLAEALGVLGAKWAVAPLCLVPSDVRPQKGENFAAAIGRSVAAAGHDIWKRTASILNEKASALKPLGVNVGYHNHNLEFAAVGETTGWDILWHETAPDLVSFEVDIGWVVTGGLDPVAFLERSLGRVSLIHVKDVASGNLTNFAISMNPAEVGSGTLPFDKILPAAYRAGARHFLVEQEPPFVIPRMEAAARSYAFLSRLTA